MQQPAFTITASHPLIWCDRAGVTLRCLHVSESALLMGFEPGWKLPLGSRVGLRAVGNAVPPPLSAAVMRAAVVAVGSSSQAAPPPTPSRSHEDRPALEEGAAQTEDEAEDETSASEETVQVLAEQVGALKHSVRRLKRRVGVLEGRRG